MTEEITTKKFTILDADGNYVRHGICPADQFDSQLIPSNGEVTILEGIYTSDKYRFEDSTPVPKGEAPSEFHVWDEATTTWVPDIDAAIRVKKVAIEQERQLRNFLPIAYDDALFDADEPSRKNISNKLLEINACQENNITISSMIWRDAENNDHFWSDVTVFKTWLQGLVATLGARETANYLNQFAHKDAIAALAQNPNSEEALSDIVSYDITTGWT